jgi:hypothetical protein
MYIFYFYFKSFLCKMLYLASFVFLRSFSNCEIEVKIKVKKVKVYQLLV